MIFQHSISLICISAVLMAFTANVPTEPASHRILHKVSKIQLLVEGLERVPGCYAKESLCYEFLAARALETIKVALELSELTMDCTNTATATTDTAAVIDTHVNTFTKRMPRTRNEWNASIEFLSKYPVVMDESLGCVQVQDKLDNHYIWYTTFFYVGGKPSLYATVVVIQLPMEG